MLKKVLDNSHKRFESVNGAPIVYHESKNDDGTASFTIKNLPKIHQYEMACVFLFISALNIVGVAYSVVNVVLSMLVYISTLVFFGGMISQIRKGKNWIFIFVNNIQSIQLWLLLVCLLFHSLHYSLLHFNLLSFLLVR